MIKKIWTKFNYDKWGYVFSIFFLILNICKHATDLHIFFIPIHSWQQVKVKVIFGHTVFEEINIFGQMCLLELLHWHKHVKAENAVMID